MSRNLIYPAYKLVLLGIMLIGGLQFRETILRTDQHRGSSRITTLEVDLKYRADRNCYPKMGRKAEKQSFSKNKNTSKSSSRENHIHNYIYININILQINQQTSSHELIPGTFAPKVLNPDFAHRLLQMDRTHISLTLRLGTIHSSICPKMLQ